MNSNLSNYLYDCQKKIPPPYFDFCQRNIPNISCNEDRMTMGVFIQNLSDKKISVSNSVIEFCYTYSDVQVLEELRRIFAEHYLCSLTVQI